VSISGWRRKASGWSWRASLAIKNSVRQLARALLAGTIVALVLDLLMRAGSSLTLPALRLDGLMERAASVSIAGLFYITASFWAQRAEEFGAESVQALQVSGRAAFVFVGLALIAWSLLWAITTWMLAAFSVSIIGSLFFAHVPQILAGAALIAWSKHISD
jgi:hypothetical protein